MRASHRDEDAVQVPRLGAGSGPVFGLLFQQLCQPPQAGHAHDVDVVVAAEGLKQREVDLQGDVTFILLIGSEHAQNHPVRISR